MGLEPATIYLSNAIASAAERSVPDRNESDAFAGGKSNAKANDQLELSLRDCFEARDLTDEELLKRASGGAREALSALFRRHASSVRNAAYRILRNAAEADDLVQEVFLYIFGKAALFDPSRSTARSWIMQVAYHRAFDRRRYLLRRRFYDCVELDGLAGAALQSQVTFYEQTLEGALGADALARIEETLSPDQRRTLHLFFFEGCSFAEIAREMQQSPGNIRNHYYRALAKIRKLLFPARIATK